MIIKREFYLNKLIERKHNGLIKVVTGIRRCGKSYLLNSIFYTHLLSSGVPENHIIRFAFDSADDLLAIGEELDGIYEGKRKVDPKKFMNYISSKVTDGDIYYLLLDEVQNLGSFEAVLNGYMRRDNMDIYVTGSNAKFLSVDVITEFAGRGDEIHLNPLSFAEFMSVFDGNKYDGFDKYVLYGGLPSVVLEADPERKINTLNSLFTETYIKDIVRRNKIRNPGEMEDLVNILASNIGTLTSPSKLQSTFETVKKSKITATTITKYLGYLADSFIIEYAKRYDIKGKSYIETPLKYYFSDLGLRNARINFRQIEMTHSMENAIYNELKCRGFGVDVGCVQIVERNADGVPVHKQLEIDFIANKGSKRYYIQSAYAIPDSEKAEQESRPLKKTDDSFKKIIITRDAPAPLYSEDGILTMNIYDFLLNPDSLDY